jgi:NDP-sugar pyrophosphorylase family protein
VLEAMGLEHWPKCLVPVNGKPFLWYVLDHLVAQGIKRIVLCVGYQKELIRESVCGLEGIYGNRRMPGWHESNNGIAVLYSEEEEPLGTAGAIQHALPLLDGDTVLVLNGDTFCKFGVQDLFSDLMTVIKTNNECSSAAVCRGINVITDVAEASGVWLIRKSLIKQDLKNLQCILDGWHIDDVIYAFDKSHDFLDIGTPEGYAKAETFLRERGMIT